MKAKVIEIRCKQRVPYVRNVANDHTWTFVAWLGVAYLILTGIAITFFQRLVQSAIFW